MASRGIIKTLSQLEATDKWWNQAVKESVQATESTQVMAIPSCWEVEDDGEKTVVDMFNQQTVKSRLPEGLATIIQHNVKGVKTVY